MIYLLIFVQVVNLQSQLTSLKTQAALQEFATSSTSSPQEERLPYNDFYQTQASIPNQSINVENYMMNYDNGFIESANFSESSQDCNVYSTVSGGSSSCDMKPFYSEGMDDLQSLAFSSDLTFGSGNKATLGFQCEIDW